ncbi:hypothetical protein [Flavobacterium panacagri]|uniref:hypothetical protein n=1 Tax=Flavobacterium panacagri TaxID=3034146 RepID=UPI0025A5B3AC|nr:hypothetical protein [Flavobacterium panacagri]
MIVFGHRNFKIKEIHPNELGLIDDTDYMIEIRQKYVHIYFIPFFGIGKIWGIRKHGELYELPMPFIHEIKRREIKVRSPWYTYTLPILLLFASIIYFGGEALKEHDHEKRSKIYFTETVQGMYYKIDNAKSNEIYTLNNVEKDDSESKMYLKVEKVYPEKIVFTLIPGFFLNSTNTGIEECYNDHKANLDIIAISKTELKKAVNDDYELSKTYAYKGQKLLNSNISYALTEIEKKFDPKISIADTSIDYKTIKIQLQNNSGAFKIVSFKNITNSIPWSNKLPIEVSAGTSSNPTFFILENTENDKFSFYGNQDYSTELKIIDSNNIEYTYLLRGRGASNFITLSSVKL